MMDSKNVLVTGANGFVGSSLCNKLRADSIPFVGAVRKKTMECQFEVGDLNAKTDWSCVLPQCDVVIHLAARVHVTKETSQDPLAAFRMVNVDATVNLAKQAVEFGIKRFIFVSSIAVNGNETKYAPFTAFDEPVPINPYGQSKYEAEKALRELSRVTGLEVVIIRPPTVYGPGVPANFLRLMELVKMGIPLPLGAIHNRRSMVALENLIDLLIVCISHPKALGETFLVADDEDISITELLEIIARKMKKHSFLLPVPAKLVAASAFLLGKRTAANRLLAPLQVDATHTKETLGWKPIASMEDSVNKTVMHFLSTQK